MEGNLESSLSTVIKQQRVAMSISLKELATRARISASHLGRIERGERFPSARTLRKIAKPLGFEEDELFTLAGYLSPQPAMIAEGAAPYKGERLDPWVANVLAREPIETQRTVIAILSILKSLARATGKSQTAEKTREPLDDCLHFTTMS